MKKGKHTFSVFELAFGVLVALVAIAVKIYFRDANAASLLWLLSPTVFWVETTSGLDFNFDNQISFVCTQVNPTHIVDESCSGLNFFVISILVGGFLYKDAVKNSFTFLKYLLITVFSAWLLTIIINTGRIILSVLLIPRIMDFFETSYKTVHLILGIFMYLTALIIYYSLLSFALNYNKSDSSSRANI